MHLLSPLVLGMLIFVMLAALVVIKQKATGSVLDKPSGGPLLQAVNIFNLFFLLVANPLTAIGLIMGWLPAADPIHVTINTPWLLAAVEVVGLVLYVGGFGLMAWALTTLGNNYQLGGSAPRAGDRLVLTGPYATIRHPMYTAALSISLGLALLLQSEAFLLVLLIYLVLILALIPIEEGVLTVAYGARYREYQRRSGALLPERH